MDVFSFGCCLSFYLFELTPQVRIWIVNVECGKATSFPGSFPCPPEGPGNEVGGKRHSRRYKVVKRGSRKNYYGLLLGTYPIYVIIGYVFTKPATSENAVHLPDRPAEDSSGGGPQADDVNHNGESILLLSNGHVRMEERQCIHIMTNDDL